MSELKRIAENIRSAFEENDYPRDFLDAYDQMECLASHSSREVFLVRGKANGELAVAKCYDRAVFPFHPAFDLMKDITHPGLPRFFELYRNDRTICTVREYVEGEPLNEYVRDRKLSVKQIVSFGIQLCGILSVLHGHTPPVIHRDIKPENIIVKPDESLVLIDFDISRSYKENAGNDTVFFGTKGYASPEQYGFGQTDSRTDIYALGVLLRWLVTGSTKENPNVEFNMRLQKIIERCTAFSPEERYTEACEVRKALEKVREKRRMPPALRKAIAIALLTAAACFGFSAGRYTGWLRSGSGISFREPLIEQAVRMQLGKERGLLTAEDLLQVRRLYIYGSEVYDNADAFYQQNADEHTEGTLHTLEDLKQLLNLEEIHICRQGAVDLSGIEELPLLYTVDLMHMHVSDLQPVARVSRLKHAVLFDCGLTDVSALQNSSRLETLNVGLNDLTDLEQLGFQPNMRELGLMWLKLKNTDGLSEQMPALRSVTLQHGSIADLTGLKKLPELETVYVLQEQYDTVKELFENSDVEILVTEN